MIRTKQRALLVVGMHRSGTSAVARMLNLLGAELSDTLLPAGVGNELGHWEQSEVLALHEEMLQSAGSAYHDVFGVEPSWFESPSAQHYGDALADLISSRFRDAPLLAVKDPRAALLVPIWLDAFQKLEIEPSFVVPFRHPLEVEMSLKQRFERTRQDVEWLTGHSKLLWLRYVLSAEKATRDSVRSFVHFDALLKDWKAEAQRIAAQLKIVWPRQDRSTMLAIDSFLDSKHKHESAAAGKAPHESESPWVAAVFDQLLTCVSEPQSGAETFDRAEAAFSESTRLFGDYVSSLRTQFDHVAPLRIALGKSAEEIKGVQATIEELNKAMMESQRALAETQAALATRDQRLAQAMQDIAARNQTLAETQAALTTSDQQLAQAMQDVAARNQTLAETHAALTTRDQQLAQAVQDVAARNQALVETQTALTAHDQQLGQAMQDVAARNQALTETQAALTNSKAVVSSRDLALAETVSRLEALDHALRATRASVSWRITSPVRTISSRFPRLGRFGRRAAKLAWWTATLQLPSRLRERRQR